MPEASSASSNRARRISAVVLVLFAIGALLTAGLWVREHAIAEADGALRTQALALSRGDIPAPGSVGAVDENSAPRLLLSDAIYRARALQTATGPERDQALPALSLQTDMAINARPHWGQAWVVKAYIESLASGAEHRQASLMALSRSYADAPFLRDASTWRVLYGFAHWEELDAFVRQRVIEEATWLVRVDHGMQSTIFAAARNTNAYQRLILRWRELRLTDGDYLAPGVAMPLSQP